MQSTDINQSVTLAGHQQQTHPMPQIQQQSSPHTEDNSKKKPTDTTHTANLKLQNTTLNNRNLNAKIGM
jgi:hypothetical protein